MVDLVVDPLMRGWMAFGERWEALPPGILTDRTFR
jgi:hypothetical protein